MPIAVVEIILGMSLFSKVLFPATSLLPLLEDTIITSDFDFIHFQPDGQNEIQCHTLPGTYKIARNN